MPNEVTTLKTTLGLRQEDLARLLGISRSQVAMMEISQRAPKNLAYVYLVQATRICDTLPPIQALPLEPNAIQSEARRMLHKLQLQAARLEMKLERTDATLAAARRLLAFCNRMRLEPGVAERKLDTVLTRLEKKAKATLEGAIPKTQQQNKLLLRCIQAQISIVSQSLN